MEHPEKKTSIPHILDSTTILSATSVMLVVVYKNLTREKSNSLFGQAYSNCLLPTLLYFCGLCLWALVLYKSIVTKKNID